MPIYFPRGFNSGEALRIVDGVELRIDERLRQDLAGGVGARELEPEEERRAGLVVADSDDPSRSATTR